MTSRRAKSGVNWVRGAGLAGALALGITAAYYVYQHLNTPIPAEEPNPTPNTRKKGLGKLVVVVTQQQDLAPFLADTKALVVGINGLELRHTVNDKDAYRVIETQTEKGWTHVVKHLRPDTVALDVGLDGLGLQGFVGKVVGLEEVAVF